MDKCDSATQNNCWLGIYQMLPSVTGSFSLISACGPGTGLWVQGYILLVHLWLPITSVKWMHNGTLDISRLEKSCEQPLSIYHRLENPLKLGQRIKLRIFTKTTLTHEITFRVDFMSYMPCFSSFLEKPRATAGAPCWLAYLPISDSRVDLYL